MSNIGILGAGTWGVALARMLSNHGHGVTVWSAIEAEIDALDATRRHPNLPDMVVPDAVCFTKSIGEACEGRDIVLFAVPSVFLRGVARQAAPHIVPGQILVDVAKGLESGTHFSMTQVIRDELRKSGVPFETPLVALSGPTHAEEVARDLPTAILSASDDAEAALRVQRDFMNPRFRVYTNGDVLGVELCGAVKNIIALAAGISAGLGYGDNAKAAIITRGLAEIARLGRALGCREQTFAGLAGMGDLIVTATSVHSRNNRCGTLIGQGVPVDEAIRRIGMVVEGINALKGTLELARQHNIDMPIAQAVDAIVSGGMDPEAAVDELMLREMKSERD